MNLKKLIITFVSILTCLSLNCNQKQQNTSENSPATITIEDKANFMYVAVTHRGPYEDHYMILKELLTEIENQQIIPTGPMCVIYYNNPEETAPQDLEWEIAVPTAEGTMVKEPLILKRWYYNKVAKVRQDVVIPITQNIYTIIFKQISEKNLTYQGPVALRVIKNFDNDSLTTPTSTEIWFPVVGTNYIAE